MQWTHAALMCLPLLGCGSGQAQATAELRAALETRDPEQVSAAARAAAAWEGEDPALDHLLGDALANVLMKPEEGWPLLLAQPLPEDPAWQEAVLGAALRDTSAEVRLDWPVRLGRGVEPHPVAPQLSARARRDPQLGWAALEAAVAACQLLDAAPTRGRRSMSGPGSGVLEAARELGATALHLGRPDFLSDPEPATGRGLLRCQRERLIEAGELPRPIVKVVVAAAVIDGAPVWLWLHEGHQGAQVIAGFPLEPAARWVEAAGGPPATETIRALAGDEAAVEPVDSNAPEVP